MTKSRLSCLANTVRCRIADLRGRGVYADFADEHHAIFIHIPKVGGTSMTSTLFGRAARHVPWREYYRANPSKFRRYFKFSFVRNPWERLVSTYFFLKAGGMNSLDRAWAEQSLGPYADFQTFVLDWLTPTNAAGWVHFMPQHSWICDAAQQCRMDFVGRFEYIERDFLQVAKQIGCGQPLSDDNRSDHYDYREYYTPETRNRVAEVYADDIRIFDYQFSDT